MRMNLAQLVTRVTLGVLTVALLPALFGQNNAIVPNSSASTEGTGTIQDIFLVGGDATVQLFLDNSQLTNFTSGDQIAGMSVRLDAAEATNAAISYTQFDIEFSQADTASASSGLLASTTFATNQGSAPILVRSGALSISAGEITAGSSPNDFSFVIPFTTTYTYTGGTDIVITVRMSGITGSGTILDTVPTNQANQIDWQGAFGSNTATVSTSTIIAAPVVELLSEPEMDLLDGTTPVANAGTIPLGNFGNAGIAFTQTVIIENNGVEDLTITTPVAAPGSLTNCSASIASQPAATVFAGSSTTMGIQINPTVTGFYSCTISISNNDRNEDPYVFTITGTAFPPRPEMDLVRGTAVADGGTDPVGDVDFSVTQTLTYTIQNNGSDVLNLTGTPLLLVTTGSNVTTVGIVTEPGATVAAGGSTTTFTISYVVTAAGAWDLTVSIASDDADEDPYNWTVSGSSTNEGFIGTGPECKKDETCSTGAGGGSSWMILLSLLSIMALSVRLRGSRAA